MSITELLNTFANNLLPILLIAAAGFLLGKTLTVDSRTIGRVVFYVFSPLLVFNLMVTSRLNAGQAFLVVGYTAGLITVMGLAAFLLGRIFRLEHSHLLAVVLTVAFGNTGNYGLPLVKFAFGDEALAVASIFYVTTTILLNTAGVMIASLGHMNLRSAVLGIFKLPIVYGVGLALMVKGFGLDLPTAVSRTIDIAASGAVPLMILLLGLELTKVEWAHSFRAVGVGVLVKLLMGPAAGLVLAGMFGLQGESRQAGVIQASMPAAVATTVLAAEYRLESSLVTAIVFLGTVLSPITLTPLIVFLSG